MDKQVITYLTPKDKDAFLDFPKRKLKIPNGYKACPLCYGYGGWNLRVNAYSLNGLKNTAANRHTYVHFRQVCYHCFGWGIVEITNECTEHDFGFTKNLGRCLNLYTCKKCGYKWEVDSSD